MTFSPFPGAVVPSDPSGLDAARHLLHARRHLDDADDALRLALGVPWDSPAAAAFREALGLLRGLLADERAVLDELRWRAAGRR
jgi:hypothetical protein